MTSKEILYPIFLQCCQYCDDVFWESVFNELSYGKTPYGIYINKGFLCCNHKDKEFNYKIDSNAASKKIYTDIKNMFTKVGIMSQRDKIHKKISFYDVETKITNSRKSWANIRKKTLKDILIENFVLDMKVKHNLSIIQSKYLLSLLFDAFIFKVILPTDVKYKDGKIISIDGINFENGKVSIDKNIYNGKQDILTDTHVEKKISTLWDRYISMLQKLE
jgi:hypothetical protein